MTLLYATLSALTFVFAVAILTHNPDGRYYDFIPYWIGLISLLLSGAFATACAIRENHQSKSRIQYHIQLENHLTRELTGMNSRYIDQKAQNYHLHEALSKIQTLTALPRTPKEQQINRISNQTLSRFPQVKQVKQVEAP